MVTTVSHLPTTPHLALCCPATWRHLNHIHGIQLHHEDQFHHNLSSRSCKFRKNDYSHLNHIPPHIPLRFCSYNTRDSNASKALLPCREWYSYHDFDRVRWANTRREAGQTASLCQGYYRSQCCSMLRRGGQKYWRSRAGQLDRWTGFH
jgi:hypothetical protein